MAVSHLEFLVEEESMGSRALRLSESFAENSAIPMPSAFERILQKRGYCKTGLRKIEAARAIAAHIDPGRNRSHSFSTFCWSQSSHRLLVRA